MRDASDVEAQAAAAAAATPALGAGMIPSSPVVAAAFLASSSAKMCLEGKQKDRESIDPPANNFRLATNNFSTKK